MATKTNLINAINAQITAIITQAKHRLSMLEFVNEIYPTPILDTQATTNVVTKIGTNHFTYNLQFSKVGRNIHIYGIITNVSGSILDSVEDILEVTNSEFEPYTTYIFMGSNSNGNVGLSFNSDALTLVSSIGVGETIFINQTYQSLN
jgi:hypothetical protein